MAVRTVRITVDGETVTGRLAGNGAPGLLLAHGAGTNQDHPRIVELRDGLAAKDLTVLTFNYRYTELGRRAPDSQPRLVDVHRAARDFLSEKVGSPVFLAGRSMGGRMGTYLAAAGEPCLGLICFAYPLHPPGKPDKMRVDHLPSISVPMLFFQGSRDPLSRMDLFNKYVRPLPKATVELLDADHSLGGARNAERLIELTAEWVVGVSTTYP
ncbi:MAG: alpha/beta hydrolase family protein [Acidimicrobiia bacterium]